MNVELSAVGAYHRPLGASVDRLLENALDWEHLPHLHASTFSAVTCLDAGPWGFRAEVTMTRTGDVSLLELRLEREERRWVSRTSDGAEIWSVATATGERTCDVDVSFLVPGVAPERAARVGDAYASLYRRLYDEDESMMIGRQTYLDREHTEQRCPHRGGPLEPCDGLLRCPWHGYRYDPSTGECLDDPRLRLPAGR